MLKMVSQMRRIFAGSLITGKKILKHKYGLKLWDMTLNL